MGGYFGGPFKGQRSVTQLETTPPPPSPHNIQRGGIFIPMALGIHGGAGEGGRQYHMVSGGKSIS